MKRTRFFSTLPLLLILPYAPGHASALPRSVYEKNIAQQIAKVRAETAQNHPHAPFRASAPVCEAQLLGSPQPLHFVQDASGLHITLPATPRAGLPHEDAYSVRLRTQCERSASQ